MFSPQFGYGSATVGRKEEEPWEGETLQISAQTSRGPSSSHPKFCWGEKGGGRGRKMGAIIQARLRCSKNGGKGGTEGSRILAPRRNIHPKRCLYFSILKIAQLIIDARCGRDSIWSCHLWQKKSSQGPWLGGGIATDFSWKNSDFSSPNNLPSRVSSWLQKRWLIAHLAGWDRIFEMGEGGEKQVGKNIPPPQHTQLEKTTTSDDDDGNDASGRNLGKHFSIFGGGNQNPAVSQKNNNYQRSNCKKKLFSRVDACLERWKKPQRAKTCKLRQKRLHLHVCSVKNGSVKTGMTAGKTYKKKEHCISSITTSPQPPPLSRLALL